MSLDRYFSQLTIVESKKGVKVMKRTSEILDKHFLEETTPLTVKCGYVFGCKDRVNGMCGFRGKWCSQQLREE